MNSRRNRWRNTGGSKGVDLKKVRGVQGRKEKKLEWEECTTIKTEGEIRVEEGRK